MTTNLPTRTAAVTAFLDQLQADRRAATATIRRGRLVFSLDATASREPTWDTAARLQGEMFEAAAAHGGLDVQLVYYRGFDQCRASRWATGAAELHRLMAQVHCEAGETQIDRILEHTIRETGLAKVNALVFVGDAMEEKLDRLARHAGELGRRGVPVFLFHEGNDPVAVSAFRRIASLTRGASFAFDLNSAGRLRELLGAVAAYAAGGRRALEAYGKGKGGEVRFLTSQLGG